MSKNNFNEQFASKIALQQSATNYAQTIIDNCTLAEIKEILARKNVRLPKTFKDGINKENVESYVPLVSTLDISVLAQHLQSQQYTRVLNPTDISSYVKDNIVSMTLGGGEIINKFKGDDGTEPCKKATTKNCVVGGLTAPLAAAMYIAASSKVHPLNENKPLHYSKDNELAPNDAMCTLAPTLSTCVDVSHDSVFKLSKAIDALEHDKKEYLVRNFNAVVPRIMREVRDDKGNSKKVETPVMQFSLRKAGDKSVFSLALSDFTPVPHVLQGEYETVNLQSHKYIQGLGYPMMRRIARNMWTGTPSDALNADDVIALHDAGVVPGKRVLVVTKDANLLTMLRANFGSQIFGVGSGEGYLPLSMLPYYIFDYIYYPEHFTVSTTGSFSDAMITAMKKLTGTLIKNVTGKLILHLSPMFFYCVEFCNALGLKLQINKNTKRVQASSHALKMQPDQPRLYEASKEVVYNPDLPQRVKSANGNVLAEDDEVGIASHYAQKGNVTQSNQLLKLDRFNDFRCCMWGEMSGLKVPCKLTQSSFKQTVLFCSDIQCTPIDLVLGNMIEYYRCIYKSVWVGGVYSQNRYEIRRIVKGAMLSDMTWSDEWSAIYNLEVVSALTESSDFESDLAIYAGEGKSYDEGDSFLKEVVNTEEEEANAFTFV